MIRYTKPLSSPIKTANEYKLPTPISSANSHRITSAQDNIISLTPIWEFVVRTKSLPGKWFSKLFFHGYRKVINLIFYELSPSLNSDTFMNI